MTLLVSEKLSPNFTPASGRPIDLVVVHTMEIAEKGTTAETCAAFFAKSSARVSAHYCVDSNSVVRCVREKDVAWAAPGANHDGVQLEHAGYARQTAAEWDDKFSRDMLTLSAELASGICKRHNIPVRFILAPGLAAGLRGITTHLQVSRAFGLSHHWDPGYNFPMERYLSQVRKFGVPTRARVEKTPEPTLRIGDKGWKVAQAERLLNNAHQTIVADGVFDEWTENAVLGFQRRYGLRPDGVIGQLTWRALWSYRYLGSV